MGAGELAGVRALLSSATIEELARISHRVHDKQAVLCYNWCVHNKL